MIAIWTNKKFEVCKEKGVKLAINPAAHNLQGLHNIQYRIGIA